MDLATLSIIVGKSCSLGRRQLLFLGDNSAIRCQGGRAFVHKAGVTQELLG